MKQFFLDDDEKRFLDYLRVQARRKLAEGEVGALNVFDVGAAKGNYSMYLFNFFWDCEMRFMLFEPTPTQFKNTYDECNPHQWFQVVNYAVGNENGDVQMVLGQNPEHSHAAKPTETEETFTVGMTTLKRFIETKHPVEEVFLLKIDTEGWEYRVLDGLADKIEMVDYVQLEYGGGWGRDHRTINDCIAYMESKGFHCLEYVPADKSLKITKAEDFVDDKHMRNILFVRQFDELA